MAEDLGDKTESATDRQRQKLREEGQIPRSTELAGALALAGSFIALVLFSPYMLNSWRLAVYEFLDGGLTYNEFDTQAGIYQMSVALWMTIKIAAPFLISMLFIALLANFWQVGFLLSAKPLTPKFSKLNPITGIKKFVSIRTLVRAATNVSKVGLIFSIATVIVAGKIPEIIKLGSLSYTQAIHNIGQMFIQLAIWLLLVLIVMGIIDYIYQKWQWEKDNKMSKHAVKEEMRNMIGDPHVRKRQREFAHKILRQRLGKSVPQADVIVTNPEHLAIALVWDPDTMNAPKVLAKGADYLALRIRQIAIANKIPIVERKPLARAMYPAVKVGDEIPPQFYQAIAEILAYVYQLKNHKKAG